MGPGPVYRGLAGRARREGGKMYQLDSYTAEESTELLSDRLWRRYGGQSMGLLENIRENPREAEVLIHGTEYIRCELRQAAKRK